MFPGVLILLLLFVLYSPKSLTSSQPWPASFPPFLSSSSLRWLPSRTTPCSPLLLVNVALGMHPAWAVALVLGRCSDLAAATLTHAEPCEFQRVEFTVRTRGPSKSLFSEIKKTRHVTPCEVPLWVISCMVISSWNPSPVYVTIFCSERSWLGIKGRTNERLWSTLNFFASMDLNTTPQNRTPCGLLPNEPTLWKRV
jgi:hypothetical protein